MVVWYVMHQKGLPHCYEKRTWSKCKSEKNVLSLQLTSFVLQYIFILQCQKTLQKFWRATLSRVSELLLWLIVDLNQSSTGTKSRMSTGSLFYYIQPRFHKAWSLCTVKQKGITCKWLKPHSNWKRYMNSMSSGESWQ